MNSLNLIRNIDIIINSLRVHPLIKIVGQLIEKEHVLTEDHKTKFYRTIFQASQGFHSLMQNEETKQILDQLRFDIIYEPILLTNLITTVKTLGENEKLFTKNIEHYALFSRFHADLESMVLYQQLLHKLIFEKTLITEEIESEAILELEIIDYYENGIEYKRFQAILDSLEKLFDEIKKLTNEKNAQLRIAYSDSGSNVLIAILSNINVIKWIKDSLIEIWKTIKFMKYDEFDRKMKSIGEGLSVIALIDKQANFDTETADKMKYIIVKEMRTLISNGVSINEFELEERVNHRELLLNKRNPKLIEKPKPKKTDTNSKTQDSEK